MDSIFKVTVGGWNGFQFDDPAKRPKRVTLELYDAEGRHVEILFGLPASPAGGITQADINRVLVTLKADDQLTANDNSSRKYYRGQMKVGRASPCLTVASSVRLWRQRIVPGRGGSSLRRRG